MMSCGDCLTYLNIIAVDLDNQYGLSTIDSCFKPVYAVEKVKSNIGELHFDLLSSQYCF